MDALLPLCHSVAVASQRASPWEPMDTFAAGYVTWPDWERVVTHSEVAAIHWQELAFFLRRWHSGGTDGSSGLDLKRFDDTLRRFINSIAPRLDADNGFIDALNHLRSKVQESRGALAARHNHTVVEDETTPQARYVQHALLSQPSALSSGLSPNRRALAVGLNTLQQPPLVSQHSTLRHATPIVSPKVPPPPPPQVVSDDVSIWITPRPREATAQSRTHAQVTPPVAPSPYLLNPLWQQPVHQRLRSPERPAKIAPVAPQPSNVIMTPRSTSVQHSATPTGAVSDVKFMDRDSSTASTLADARTTSYDLRHMGPRAGESSATSTRSQGPQTPGPARRNRLRVREDPSSYA